MRGASYPYVYEYDPVVDSWTLKEKVFDPIKLFSAFTSVNGVGYVIPGKPITTGTFPVRKPFSSLNHKRTDEDTVLNCRRERVKYDVQSKIRDLISSKD